MKNKLNLIIDFNNILLRSACLPGLSYSNSTFDKDEDVYDCLKKVTIDICFNIRLFNPTNVILLCDSPNAWRKDLLPNDENGYKANRIKDETKNWDNFFKIVNEYKELLQQKGLTVVSIPRAEADDLAALYKQKLYTLDNESIIFISSDKDWRQLIDFDASMEKYVMVYNSTTNNKGRKKLYTTEDTIKFINTKSELSQNDKISLLFGDMVNSNLIKESIINAQTNVKMDIEYVNPDYVIIEKIFGGDAGDNVPGYYTYYKTNKRGTYKTTVTPSQIKKLIENLHINNMNDFIQCIDYIKPELEKIMKISLPVDNNSTINRQRCLVELNPTLFPINIVKEFDELYREQIPFGNNNYESIKWTTLLKDSKFMDVSKLNKPATSTVFKDFSNASGFDKYLNGLFD
jgi:hypothetical protein